MDEKVVLAIAQNKAAEAGSVTQEKVTEAVSDYITDNPSALNQSAVEAIVGDRIDDIVLVQNTQPTEEDNKIWIPNSEIAETQVPTYEEFSQLKNSLDTATNSDIGKALSPKTVTGGHVTEWQFKSIGGGGSGNVSDVTINDVSVLVDGVANIPIANGDTFGIVKTNTAAGIDINGTTGKLRIASANGSEIRAGTSPYRPITPSNQDQSTFYGLAKAAGSDEKDSTLPVGQYTDAAKSAIQTMLNGPVSISGTTPSITALPGIQYVCGECATLDITLPASGCVDVVFESGSTATVLTVTPPTGVTVKWANGFDPTTLEANTTYEINIMNGLGVAVSWT